MAKKTKFELGLRAAFERTAGPENVNVALRLIRGEVDPLVVSKAAEWLERQSYNPQDLHTLTMTALDDLLGTHGVEYLGEVDMHAGPPIEYLNVGDSYAATLIWFRSSGRFYIKSWGDVVEASRGRL